MAQKICMKKHSANRTAKVSTNLVYAFAVPEGRWILAGGGTAGTAIPKSPAPEGRQTSLGLSPLRG
jgi:hypothetical protein